MILVFGRIGQVGTELSRLVPDATFLDRDEIDLTRPESCVAAIDELRPEAVINAAAYTAVDKAEEDEAIADLINGVAPGRMAGACAALDIPFVHISTDYVFEGTGSAPYAPDAPTGPLSVYGRTKLKGELAVRASGATFATFRTSWVFSAQGGNFVKTMLRLSETRDSLNVVADQIGGPTPAAAIAEACVSAAEALRTDPEKSGTYHLSGAPDVSWADFAREIFRQAGRTVTVNDIPTAEYPTPAHRPANSRLDCTSLEAFGLSRPDWKTHLHQILTELGEAK